MNYLEPVTAVYLCLMLLSLSSSSPVTECGRWGTWCLNQCSKPPPTFRSAQKLHRDHHGIAAPKTAVCRWPITFVHIVYVKTSKFSSTFWSEYIVLKFLLMWTESFELKIVNLVVDLYDTWTTKRILAYRPELQFNSLKMEYKTFRNSLCILIQYQQSVWQEN